MAAAIGATIAAEAPERNRQPESSAEPVVYGI
jgi:hypothetical protein